jgi:hypothetical protein
VDPIAQVTTLINELNVEESMQNVTVSLIANVFRKLVSEGKLISFVVNVK